MMLGIMIRFGLVPILVHAIATQVFLPRAQAVEATEVKLPDTHAGRCAAAFLAAFNSGTDEALQSFEETYRSAAGLKSRSIADRIAQAREMRREFGTLRTRKIMNSKERSITLAVESVPMGTLREFSFEFESEAPHKLVAIRIAGPLRPESIEAAAVTLDADIRADTVAAVAKALREEYVFPDKGAAMAEVIEKHLAAGDYDAITDAGGFADRLTADVHTVAHDKHLRIMSGTIRTGGADGRTAGALMPERDNYGFVRVEILAGNVGLLKFNLFHPSDEARMIARAAMKFLQECDALIFDVRDNGGGSPEMIKFLTSYLFDVPTHLNSFYDRNGIKTSESWTQEKVPGRRYDPGTPVYVLTSGRTFSAAEEFTYNLQQLKRARIVGETTGGGAHPVSGHLLNDHFEMSIPFSRAENPISKTNWEGVGVVPDIATSAGDALEHAHREALEQLSARRKP